MQENNRLMELQTKANRLIRESANLIAEVKILAESCRMEKEYEKRIQKLITQATLEHARCAALENENLSLRQKLGEGSKPLCESRSFLFEN